MSGTSKNCSFPAFLTISRPLAGLL
jgi:hypothetical protein